MDKIIFKKVGQRLKQAREENHITLEDAGKKVDVHKSTVLRWENGETEKIKLPVIDTLAKYYGVNPVWLAGHDVEKYINNKTITDELGNPVVDIPLVGAVKAGYNYLAQENIIDKIQVEASLVGNGSEYFALEVKGDSMAPSFLEGDIVIIHKQNDCENNQIAIVIVNGEEGTIKKVRKTEQGIILQPLNPAYAPMVFSNAEIKSIPILIVGIVKQLKREF